MIQYITSNNKTDLHGILNLQKANLQSALSTDSIASQGFVTVSHNFEDLEKLNLIEKHTVATNNGLIIGYVLAMTEKSKYDIPILKPMFELFSTLNYKNKPVSEYNYLVVGQVCVDEKFRGSGVFDALYQNYKLRHQQTYDFAITEIATTNSRSRKAHRRIGFEEIHFFTDGNSIEWVIVVWDFKQNKQPRKETAK